MDEQHTPGPWQVSDKNDEVVTTAVGTFYWFSWIHLPHNHQQYGINPVADARLIAAAPDLLVAALAIVEKLDASIEKGQLQAAIAKATQP